MKDKLHALHRSTLSRGPCELDGFDRLIIAGGAVNAAVVICLLLYWLFH